jgi:hypothetical protein
MIDNLRQQEKTVRRVVLLTALYSVPGLLVLVPIIDPDIWWHMRTGEWIVEHRTVPWRDPFSSYGGENLWVAYSWLFEVLVYGLHRWFGLWGLILYSLTLSLLIAVALHKLVRRYALPFSSEVALTAAGLLAMKPLLSPRPWLFTILFFIIELDILLTARQSGNLRKLLWLPPLFLLWANLHIQFVYGLFVLGLAALEPLLERLRRRRDPDTKGWLRSFRFLFLVTLACGAATLLNPYHAFVYQPVILFIEQTGFFDYVSEMTAPKFRGPWDWFVLANLLGAAFSLGWWREKRPFQMLLLITGAFLSFRASRDVWVVAVSSVTVIAAVWGGRIGHDPFAITRFRAVVAVMMLIIASGIVCVRRDLSEARLQEATADKFPALAAAFVEEHKYTGPLYNHFNWGGYLLWRLPRVPVIVDGRGNVHGDKRVIDIHETWIGKQKWSSDPDLAASRLIIAGVEFPLASLLRMDSRFELVYEDKIAAVFIARSPSANQKTIKGQPQQD